MHRFFCASKNISKDKIIISDKKQVHHIKDVLWLRPKARVVVFDEKGNNYTAEVEGLTECSIVLLIKEKNNGLSVKKIQLTVACAIPKKSKFDDIVDKLTQLGVDRIIPLKTERVIVKLDKAKETLRLTRWKKVGQASSQQSQRNALPVIEPIMSLKKLLMQTRDYDLKLIPTLLGERKLLKEILFSLQPKNILVLIGPEGDFTDEEVGLAGKSGFISVTLGDTVLRVETAAVAAICMLKYALG
ncbi:MAG: RsmE family RNA methyltransferase [Candidatus Omnitrophota bacterium]|nr:RsmE family RNA methyltransferase [Candidatus Omnitrophota bacterium]